MKRTQSRLVVYIVFVFCLGALMLAQDAKPPIVLNASAPTPLTDVQKLMITNKRQALTILQLQLQSIVSQFNTAKADYDGYMATLDVKGFTLDDKLEYVAVKK